MAASDWVASYDQVRAQAEEVLDQGKRFMILWYDEDADAVGSTGMVHDHDPMMFLKALALRIREQDGVHRVSEPPGWEE